MPLDRHEWPPGIVHVHWHPLCCDLKRRRLMPRFRAKICLEISRRWISISEDDGRRVAEGANIRRQAALFWQRVEDNAFHLKNNHCIAHAYQILHARGVPVRESNASVTCGAANCLGVVRAVNANAWLV